MFVRSITGLYSWNMPANLVGKLRHEKYAVGKTFQWFWHTNTFRATPDLNDFDHSLVVVLWLGMLTQIALGITLLVDWARFGTAGALEFGAALLLSYPIVWAHVLFLALTLYRALTYVLRPKQLGRDIVCAILESQVRHLRRRHKFTVVAVAGSVGKTSTKLAIAELLGQNLRVRYQEGNYNDRVTVPLVLFGRKEPSLFNMLAWLRVFAANNAEIAFPFPYDVVVVELGTDGPGQMEQFAYLRPDLTVVTAVTPEHMEALIDMDTVAREELTVFQFSKQVLVNADDIAGAYLAGLHFKEYSLVSKQADYYAGTKPKGLTGQTLSVTLPQGTVEADVTYVGMQGAKIALAAMAVGDILGLPKTSLIKGATELKPFAGRLQIFEGAKESTIIDDTYNASPVAVKAALDVLYAARTTQRIAILGGMNELGDYAEEAHTEVGAYCDPKKLELVVTVGQDAKQWIAPAAREAGCEVRSFNDPSEAGVYVAGKLKKGAVVLAKGSQGGIFTEEAVKQLLAHPGDSEKLVRQSAPWMARKAKYFSHF
ncbi:MAG TPA: Mur ligase family protein [Candidatus Saccharimonadales bacterium]|nr:Mur ligase family protein [Candidatus Saccharimonadales bacterium]